MHHALTPSACNTQIRLGGIERVGNAALANACQIRTPSTTSPSHYPVESRSSRTGPILLLDIMDTVVYDPFYHRVPEFFDLSFSELLEAKHPEMWLLFERGQVDEASFLQNFFADGRPFDHLGFVNMMKRHYVFVEGMEGLLTKLHSMNIEIHAFSNYSNWYRFIESKLGLGRYLQWSFLSCCGPMKGVRKPETRAYEVVLETLGCDPSDLLLIDDRESNIAAAGQLGIDGIHFRDASSLVTELRKRGWDL